MKKLTEIKSMHEQREFINNVDVVIEEGIWIEIVDFDEVTEQVEILRRWKIEKIEKQEKYDVIRYKIICEELDIEDDLRRKEIIAKKVLSNHREKLKSSFAKCLIDGISTKSTFELRNMLNKLGEIEDGNKKENC